MVEQVGHKGEEDVAALGELLVGYGDGQMSLAAAGATHEDEPAVRLLSEGPRGVEGGSERLPALSRAGPALGFEGVEGHAAKHGMGDAAEAHSPRTGSAAHVYDKRIARVSELALEASVQPLEGNG